VLVQSAYKPGYMHTLEMPVQIKCLQHVYHLNVMILLLDGNQTTNIISCQQSLEAGLAGAGPLMSASVAHQAAGLTSTCDEQHSLHSQVCTCHAHVHKQFNIVNILHGASCFCSCVCCWRDTCKSVLFCYESILAIKKQISKHFQGTMSCKVVDRILSFVRTSFCTFLCCFACSFHV